MTSRSKPITRRLRPRYDFNSTSIYPVTWFRVHLSPNTSQLGITWPGGPELAAPVCGGSHAFFQHEARDAPRGQGAEAENRYHGVDTAEINIVVG